MSHRRRRRIGIGRQLAAALLVASSAQAQDAWQLLTQLRQSLSAVPLGARFVQEFIPAGFSTGDRESGRLSLGLPDCLRWDYELPYPRSFLICHQTVHTWNLGETTGRRYHLASGDETGLDLLRLEVEELRRRYRAEVMPPTSGAVELLLTPRESSFELVEARIVVDPKATRLVSIAYRDAEGNRTRFDLRDYQPTSQNDHFEPPEEIEWLED